MIIDLLFTGACAYGTYINYRQGQREWTIISAIFTFANALNLISRLR